MKRADDLRRNNDIDLFAGLFPMVAQLCLVLADLDHVCWAPNGVERCMHHDRGLPILYCPRQGLSLPGMADAATRWPLLGPARELRSPTLNSSILSVYTVYVLSVEAARGLSRKVSGCPTLKQKRRPTLKPSFDAGLGKHFASGLGKTGKNTLTADWLPNPEALLPNPRARLPNPASLLLQGWAKLLSPSPRCEDFLTTWERYTCDTGSPADRRPGRVWLPNPAAQCHQP